MANPHQLWSLRRLLVALSRNAKAVPGSLRLEGITLQDKNAVSGGGFADVYKGLYKGNLVALKRLRTFSRNPITEKQEDVTLQI